MQLLEKTTNTIKQLTVIGLAVSAVFTTLLTVTVFLFADMAKLYSRQFLGIDQLATKEDLEGLEETVNELTGQSGIIFMPPGHSYVEEPVSWGKTIKVHLIMQRTERGEACEFLVGQSLFFDSRGIPFPGPLVNPIRQLDTSATELYLELNHPIAILPGRIKLTLSMKYECDGLTEYDDTRPVFFYLQERGS